MDFGRVGPNAQPVSDGFAHCYSISERAVQASANFQAQEDKLGFVLLLIQGDQELTPSEVKFDNTGSLMGERREIDGSLGGCVETRKRRCSVQELFARGPLTKAHNACS